MRWRTVRDGVWAEVGSALGDIKADAGFRLNAHRKIPRSDMMPFLECDGGDHRVRLPINPVEKRHDGPETMSRYRPALMMTGDLMSYITTLIPVDEHQPSPESVQ
jgi:hypothetical protein